jgi:acetylornithine deacetylase
LVADSEIVKNILEREVAGRADIEYLSTAEPVRMLEVAGFDTCIVRFTTDISHLSNWGAPLLIGPGSISDAHTTHERIAKAELVRAVDLYAELVRRLLAPAQEDAPVVPDGKGAP